MATVTIPPHRAQQHDLYPPMSPEALRAIEMAREAWAAIEPRLPDDLAIGPDAADLENALRALYWLVRKAKQ